MTGIVPPALTLASALQRPVRSSLHFRPRLEFGLFVLRLKMQNAYGLGLSPVEIAINSLLPPQMICVAQLMLWCHAVDFLLIVTTNMVVMGPDTDLAHTDIHLKEKSFPALYCLLPYNGYI